MPATIQLVDVSSCDPYVSPDLEVFTCTVGKKPSAAANYVHDVEEVQELLDSLVKLSTRDQRYYSSIDLRSISNEYLSGLSPADQQGIPPPGTENSSVASLPKSMSLGMMHKPHDPIKRLSERSQVPTTLNDFLGTIDDEEEDDMFF